MGSGNKEAKQEVRDFAAKQNSDSYLASENIKRETSAEEAEEAEGGMEEMSRVYDKIGRELYVGQRHGKHD